MPGTGATAGAIAVRGWMGLKINDGQATHGDCNVCPLNATDAVMHAVHAVLAVWVVSVVHVLMGHGVGAPAPAGQKDPAGHTTDIAVVEPVGQ